MGLSILVALGTAGCSGSKSLTKKGAQLEQAGLYDNAAMYYYNSLLRNANNVDARIGLSRTGQRVVNDKLSAFSKARTLENPKEAVYQYRDMEAYRIKLANVGINTEVPSYFPEDYQSMESVYLEDLYEKGNELLGNRDFDQAHSVFTEMENLDPGYRDIRTLRNISANEPIYAAAVIDFDAARYRAAYKGFNQVFQSDPNYKEASVLRGECLDLGKFPIVIAPFDNTTKNIDVESRLHAFVLTQLSTLDDPFVKVVDRDDINRILAEQRLSLSGLTEASAARQAGNLLNAKAIVTGSVLKYQTDEGAWKKTTQRGYVRHSVKTVDEKTKTTTVVSQYEPTSYNRYSNATSVNLEFQYKVISTETGEVLFSGIFERTFSDHAEYAVYSGEITELYPAGKDGPQTDAAGKRNLMNLLRADRTVKTTDQLSKEAYFYAASQLAAELQSHLASL